MIVFLGISVFLNKSVPLNLTAFHFGQSSETGKISQNRKPENSPLNTAVLARIRAVYHRGS